MDLIKNVSDTAFWVAAYRAMETERPDAAFQDKLARKLSGKIGQRIVDEMPHLKMRAHVFTLRTLAIDRLITHAVEQGADTVINLAAGLDTRPYRLALPADINWIEVDLPGIIEYKSEMLKDEKPLYKLTRIITDLTNGEERRKLFHSLAENCNSAVVITEGLIPYLTNDQAAELAKDLYAESKFRFWIMDYYTGNLRGNVYRKKMEKRMQNAPFEFSDPEPLKFFAKEGWKVAEDITLMEEAKRLGRPMPLPFVVRIMMKFFPVFRLRKQNFVPGYVMFKRS